MASSSSGMEVDPPSSAPSSSMSAEHLGLNPLKRSNSAPMLATTASSLPHTTCSSPVSVVSTIHHSQSFNPGNSFPKHFERVRRYSASSMCLFSPSVTTPVKTPSRLAQIINEERLNVKEREEAHERETRNNLMISTSCEELSLSDPSDQEAMVTEVHKQRPRSFQEPLHIFTSPYPYASSPSPTRLGKQCFSPSLCQPVRNVTLSPSPSPTRKSLTRRSISPISMAPSRIALKRKIITESDMCDTPHKRYQPSFTCISPGCSTPEKFNTHPLLHSVSSSSLSDSGSPDQQVPTTQIHRPIVRPSGHSIHEHTKIYTTSHPVSELRPMMNSSSHLTKDMHRPMSLSSSQLVNEHRNQISGNHNELHRSMEHSGTPSMNELHHHHHHHHHGHHLQAPATFQQQHSVTPGSVFAFHPVHDSADSMSTHSSLSHESEHSDMNEDSHIIGGTIADIGGGDFTIRNSSKPSQV